MRISGEQIGWRVATLDDARVLWRLANDPLVRASSFHPEPIVWDDHVEWLSGKLNTGMTVIYLLTKGEQMVGQVRYDQVDDSTAEIDFAVDAQFRGFGLGTFALINTRVLACRVLAVSRVNGVVRQNNWASVRAFEKAGFSCLERDRQLHGWPCSIFTWCFLPREGASILQTNNP